jgi:hypothetical protein
MLQVAFLVNVYGVMHGALQDVSQCRVITVQKKCVISQYFDFRICICYESTNNSVIFLKLEVKKLIFQVYNSAIMKVLNKPTGRFNLLKPTGYVVHQMV